LIDRLQQQEQTMNRERNYRSRSREHHHNNSSKVRSDESRYRSKSRSPSPNNRNRYRNDSRRSRSRERGRRDGGGGRGQSQRSTDHSAVGRSHSRSRSREDHGRKKTSEPAKPILKTGSTTSSRPPQNQKSSTTQAVSQRPDATSSSAAAPSSTVNFAEGTKPGTESEEMTLDFEDFEDFEDKKKKDEEAAERQAAERRRRLEEIKAKHQPTAQPPQQNEQKTTNGTTIFEETKAGALPPPEDSILSKNRNSMIINEDEENDLQAIANEMNESGNQNQTSTSNNNNDNERDELERERIALEEQKETFFGKKTFDMFSDSPSDLEKLNAQHPFLNNNNLPKGKRAFREALLAGEAENNPHLQSNWDDGEGYYKATIGEVIGDRFQVQGIVGKGVFSTVLKCLDTRIVQDDDDNNENNKNSATVALKMIRNKETMKKSADREKSLLLSIAEKDPTNKRFIVRLITYLEYRSHIVMVFEYQSMNLREALKKFGRDVGINISAIKIYGKQLFIALKLLAELKIIHADIKLDNILVSEDLKNVKLCDFGSAFLETDVDNDPTPYLVSRFYRAPEIILGLPYDREIDLWSICVCLYELFTGHVMFPGRTNNEMLKLMMAMKGKFPVKMIKNHFKSYESLQIQSHFVENDLQQRFRSMEVDSVTGKPVTRILDISAKPTRDIATILRSSKVSV
jgi:serine/threonine-protein kinase PRP4